MTDTGAEREGPAGAPSRPITVAAEADVDRVVDRHEVVLLEFHTAGCSMCDAMVPVLSGVARATDAAVATGNPRDDPPLLERFDVRSVPLLVLFVDGEEISRRAEGFVPAEDVIEWLVRESPASRVA